MSRKALRALLNWAYTVFPIEIGDEVKITVKFQRGMDPTVSEYKWCEIASADVIVDPTQPCDQVGTTKTNYVTVGGDSSLNYIAQGDADYADDYNTTDYIGFCAALPGYNPRLCGGALCAQRTIREIEYSVFRICGWYYDCRLRLVAADTCYR